MTTRKRRLGLMFLALLMLISNFSLGSIRTVEAATDSLIANIDKYGFHADSKEKTVGINSSINVYPNANNAIKAQNRTGVYKAGKYYIYKSVDGSVNISVTKGKAGGWVNLNQLKAKSAEKLTIHETLPVYSNAANAKSGTSRLKSYSAGDYYIYKSATGAKNITKVPGEAGGWVNESQLSSAMVRRKPNFKLTSSTSIYSNAEDAINNRNKKGTYSAGDYFIYKTYKDAINISKTYGKPGAWIRTNAVTLNDSRNVYANAADAVAYKNPTAVYDKGVYFIYKEANNAVNISKVEGKVGGWISRSSLADSTKGNIATIVEKVDKSKPAKEIVNDFRIVLDAGHGQNDNRGGVLFDEGRQNFIFMEYIIRELKKYPGVEIFLTRDAMSKDPSLSVRATKYNDKNPDVYLSLHSNAASPNTRGVEVFGSIKNTNDTIPAEMTKFIAQVLDTPNRGVKYRDYYSGKTQSTKSNINKDYYAIMRGNQADNIYLLEIVFHTNYKDSKAYLDNQERLAKGIVAIFVQQYSLQSNSKI